MLAIQNENSSITVQKYNHSKKFACCNFQSSKDSISFYGLHAGLAWSTKDIKELVYMFYDSSMHNIGSDSKFPGFIRKFQRYWSVYPFVNFAKRPGSITEAIKLEDKLVGGYSMQLDRVNSTAYLGFITLAPDLMKTKTGVESLKLIGKRIIQNLELNNIKELTWTVNSKNISMNNLLKRFGAKKIRQFRSVTEYNISLEQFKKNLSNYYA